MKHDNGHIDLGTLGDPLAASRKPHLDGIGWWLIVVAIGLAAAAWSGANTAPDAYPTLTPDEALGRQVWDARMEHCTPLDC